MVTIKKTYNIAVVGATGAVGAEMINILEERGFPVGQLVPLASERSRGREVIFRGAKAPVGVLDGGSFEGIAIAFFSAGAAVSREMAPAAAKAGAVVVDNSSAFRMEDGVPLVVPEVNPEKAHEFGKKRIIANPNCSTIQLVVALAPLHRRFRVKRVVVSTYQSVSGAGRLAMQELSSQSQALMSQGKIEPKVFPHRIAFNCIPHIDSFLGDGSTREERKVSDEMKKILGDDSIKVFATAVRVPVFCGHSESVVVEFERPVTPDTARDILKSAAGVMVADDPSGHLYPMAADCAGKDEVFVGRIRRDATAENGLAMWIVADNLRKGAALNAVQIAELYIRNFQFPNPNDE